MLICSSFMKNIHKEFFWITKKYYFVLEVNSLYIVHQKFPPSLQCTSGICLLKYWQINCRWISISPRPDPAWRYICQKRKMDGSKMYESILQLGEHLTSDGIIGNGVKVSLKGIFYIVSYQNYLFFFLWEIVTWNLFQFS